MAADISAAAGRGSPDILETCAAHLELLGRLLRRLSERHGKDPSAEEDLRAVLETALRDNEQSGGVLTGALPRAQELHLKEPIVNNFEVAGLKPSSAISLVGRVEDEDPPPEPPPAIIELQRDSQGTEDDSEQGVPLRLLFQRTMSSFAAEGPAACGSPPLTEMLGGLCIVARVSLFLGGFAYFRRPALRVGYNALYISAFVLCGLSCLAGAIWETPPLSSWGNQLNTFLFHVVGVHTWLFWRKFSVDNRIRTFVHELTVSSMAGRDGTAVKKRVQYLVKLMSYTLLLAQLIALVLAFAAYCQPAYEHWAAGTGLGHAHHWFALVHAIVMWLVIPQVVPTLLASLVLFFFLMVCHNSDIMEVVTQVRNLDHELVSDEVHHFHSWRLLKGEHLLVDGASREERPESDPMQQRVVNAVCARADNAQRRLDYSCRSLELLHIHQVCFGFLQVIVLITHYNMRWKGRSADWDRETIYHLLMDVFHGFFALVIVLTGVLTPATTTHVFIKCPRMIISAMCNRGVSCYQAAVTVPFLYSKVVGFTTMFYIQVTGSLTTKFAALVVLGSAWYSSTLSSL